MILITGSTGHLGTSIINILLRKGMLPGKITGFARNREKASALREKGLNTCIGNYDDYESLANSFRNKDILLFISGSEVDKRDIQHENIIRAAAETGIKQIVYTSFERANDDLDKPISFIARTHIETERKILGTGINYTFLRNALYAEGLPMFLGKDVLEKGIYLPAGNGKVPFASVNDLAEATVNILMKPEDHINRSYRTINDHNYSFYEIAAILGELTGKNVRYFCPSPEEFADSMTRAGVPESAIKAITGWAGAIKEGYFESEYSDLAYLLGRRPTDMRTVLNKIYTRIVTGS